MLQGVFFIQQNQAEVPSMIFITFPFISLASGSAGYLPVSALSKTTSPLSVTFNTPPFPGFRVTAVCDPPAEYISLPNQKATE